MTKSVFFAFLSLTFWLTACSPVLKQVWVDPVSIKEMPYDSMAKITRATGLYQSCLDWDHYVPDAKYSNHLPIKTIFLNVHIMDNVDSSYNFRQEAGRKFGRDLLYHINAMMTDNAKMRLPIGNETPVLPSRLKFELKTNPEIPEDDGIYFHYDDELYFMVTRGKDRNITDRKAIDKYKVRDSVINIFIMPHHPDSVASPTYAPHWSGIALGTAVKLCGIYENNIDAYGIKGTASHEIAHVLGLAHAWSASDGCEDTPVHSNCFNYTDTSPCDKEVSNNMMDYNLWQEALTPCQIGKMHSTVARFNTNVRKVVKPDWCKYDSTATIIITDTITWGGSKDLAGDIIIEKGGHLIIKCRVSMAEGAAIIVKLGGSLLLDNAHLHNSCGASWNGILMETLGKSIPTVTRSGAVNIEHIDQSKLIRTKP